MGPMLEMRIFALDLIDEVSSIAAYEACHTPGSVPRAVIENIVGQGVKEMEIYRTGNRLIMIAVVTEDYPQPILNTEADRTWEERMWSFQRPLPSAPSNTKWVEMTRLFRLGEHL